MLAALYPHLPRYCPNLATVSAPQAAFLLLDQREAFYGGAAGGGKSDALLMAALLHVNVPGYRALILRRTFAQLSKGDALIPRSHEWLASSDAVWNEQKRVWTFPSGATLEFGHVEHETSKYDYQGAAYQFVGFDELTQFTESTYDYIGFSRARRRKQMEAIGVPIRTRATSNPGGEGHAWVKRRFIDEPGKGVVFVPAKVADNPGLDVEDYAASLAYLPDELRRQLLDGDWGAFEGAAYPEFSEETHVVDSFPPPNEWERFESMDFGAANPTAWGLYAADFDGNLIVSDLYYRPGLVAEHAGEVLARRAAGWERKGADNWPERNRCFADPTIRNRTGLSDRMGRALSVEQEFVDHGIFLVPANNDRQAGYVRIRELLALDPKRPFPEWHPRYGEYGAPQLFVMRHCRELIEQLQAAPLQPVDTALAGQAVYGKWESAHGHAHAMLRYGVMSRPGASALPEPVPQSEQDLREAAARAALERLERGASLVDV